ncbi:MAG: N-acetylmuramoyl-L-alanine amidase [Anaerolineae bacterium]|nr:N-acetylmuramoyl-L-alanine amidase [Anaerolineae bacterium]
MKNPYIGPRAFEQEESSYFFGRDEEIRILMGLVMARRVVLFFAKSGVGKSSLVRAGLIPKLTEHKVVGHGRRARRIEPKMHVLPLASVGGGIRTQSGQSIANVFIYSALLNLRPDLPGESLSSLDLTTGLQPLLEAAPTDSAGQTLPSLLVFDQFEELFNRHQEHWRQRADFFQQVSQALAIYENLRVLFIMREDYIAELIPYADLLPDRLRSRFRMEHLGHDAAIEAIEKPALQEGRHFAPGVAKALVNNLSRIQSGQQPQPTITSDDDAETPLSESFIEGASVEPVHLQVVCQQLWAKLPPDQKEITETYAKIYGDVDQALIDFYEGALVNVLTQIEISERRLRRWFDNELITPARTRGLVYRDDEQGATAGLPNEAVDILSQAWIIRADKRGSNTWYEIAHDRLVEPILKSNQKWEERHQNPISQAAEKWLASNKNPEKLYKGEQLKAAQQQLNTNPDEFTSLEKEFIQESQKENDRQRVRRQRLMIFGAIILLMTVAGLAIWAVLQKNIAEEALGEADESRTEAEQERDQSDALRLAFSSLTNLENDPDLSILLAVEAVSKTLSSGLGVTIEAEDALRKTITRTETIERELLASETMPFADVLAVSFSPDSKLLAMADKQGVVTLWDVATEQKLATKQPHSAPIYRLVFSPDGRQMATASEDKKVVIWQRDADGKIHPGLLWETAANEVAPEKQPQQREPSDGNKNEEKQSIPILSFDLAFAPDGLRLATILPDGTAKIWNIKNSTAVTLTSKIDFVPETLLTFSRDGSRLATVGPGSPITIWDSVLGEEIQTLTTPSNQITNLKFNASGTHLLVANQTGSITTWNLASSSISTITTESDGSIKDFSINTAGNRLATLTLTDSGNLIRLWDHKTGGKSLVLTRAETSIDATSTITTISFSPDNNWLASVGKNSVQLYTLDTIKLLDVVCQTSSRNFKQDEWETYIRGGIAYRKTCPELPAHPSAITAAVRDGDPGIKHALTLASPSIVGEALFKWAEELATLEGSGEQALQTLSKALELKPDIANQNKIGAAELYNQICDSGRTAHLTSIRPACEQAVTLASSVNNEVVEEVDIGILNFKVCQNGATPELTQLVEPTCNRAKELASLFISDGFDFPVGPRGRDVDVFQSYKIDTVFIDPEYIKVLGVWHPGEDWNGLGGGDTDLGDPIYAVSRGRVVEFGDYTVWGNLVLIEHFLPDGSQVWSHYAHLDQILVNKVGQKVERGQQVGTMGKGAGNRYLAHLGFEIRRNNLPITNWFPMTRDREAVLANYHNPTLFINARRQLDTTHLTFTPKVVEVKKLLEIGETLVLVGDTAEAITRFEEAKALDPELDIDTAVAEAQRLTDKANAQQLIQEGRDLAAEGDLQQAVATFQQALVLDPALEFDPHEEVRQIRDQIEAKELVSEGESLASSGAITQAVAIFEQALALNPALSFDPEQKAKQIGNQVTAQRLIDEGKTLAQTGTLTDAVDLFKQAQELAPELLLDPQSEAEHYSTIGTLSRGKNLAEAGNIDDAVQQYESAIQLDPTNVWGDTDAYHALCWYATLAQSLNSTVMRACSLSTRNTSDGYRNGRGIARALRGDFEGAVEDLSAYIRALGVDDPTYNQWFVWLDALEAGSNPFNRETLEQLQDQPRLPISYLVTSPITITSVLTTTPPAPIQVTSVTTLTLTRGYLAEYLSHDVPRQLTAGKTVIVKITLQNAGLFQWVRDGDKPFRLGFQWYDTNNQLVQLPLAFDFRTPLPRTIAPGGTIELQAKLRTPDQPGSYRLRWDMVHEMVTWFSLQGDPGLVIPITINAASVVKNSEDSEEKIGGQPAIRWVGSPNFNKRRRPDDITAIVIHATANSTLDGTISWFNNPSAQVSAHYTIGKDGQIVQHVHDIHRAWHVGRSKWQGRSGVDDFSIGIGFVNLDDGQDSYPEEQHQAAVELIAYLADKYDIEIENIVAHYDVAIPSGRKSDLRGYDMDRLRRDVTKLLESR